MSDQEMKQGSDLPPEDAGRGSRRPGEDPEPEEQPPSKIIRGETAEGVVRTPTAGPSGAEADPSKEGEAGPSKREEAGPSKGRKPSGDDKDAKRERKAINTDCLIVTKPKTQTTKQGSVGQRIKIQANYFKILSAPNWVLYQYRVDYEPPEERSVVRKGLLKLHKELLGDYMFDGTNLFTVKKYPNATKESPMQLFSTRGSDSQNITITIHLAGEMVKTDPQYLQFFNVIMRKAMQALRLQLVGRNYFDPVAKIEVPEHRFELWPGYVTVIRQYEKNLLMCAEITHKVMRQETVLDILTRTRQECQGRDYQAACKSQIIGTTVLTQYNTKTYRIDDIEFGLNPQSTFKLRKENRDISYLEYYQNVYNIRINSTTQPLLLSRPKDRDRRAGQDTMIYLIPELCRATGLTDSMKNDFRLMKAMSDHTRIGPDRRIDRLLTFNKRLQQCPEVVQDFKRWNLSLDKDIIEVPARVLDRESMVFQGGREFKVTDRADWNNALRDHRMIVTNSKGLYNWLLFYPQRIQRRDVSTFVNNLKRAAGGLGFNIQDPQEIGMPDDRPHTYANMLETELSKRTPAPQLVLCVAFSRRADIYSIIKKKCCVDRPIPSQVVLKNNLNNPKGAMSVATKIAIQLNCKIGGAPWSVHIPLKGSLMVVGFDVCHDPNRKGTDFGAMVATLNKGCTRYYSAVSHHSNNEEISNDIANNIATAAKKFTRVDGNENRLPKYIIVYRDGVGDGQIPYVYEHEVKTIENTLRKLYGGPNFKLTYIIVTKKISTRLFYNRRQNPPAGTVVDDVITNPNRYDFLLVSQHVGQGSVTPVNYNVIYDTSGFNPNVMQMLTYKLTHLYFNWSGTVRVPAPCQFAHKLAYLVAQAIQRPPSSSLADLLYFL